VYVNTCIDFERQEENDGEIAITCFAGNEVNTYEQKEKHVLSVPLCFVVWLWLADELQVDLCSTASKKEKEKRKRKTRCFAPLPPPPFPFSISRHCSLFASANVQST